MPKYGYFAYVCLNLLLFTFLTFESNSFLVAFFVYNNPLIVQSYGIKYFYLILISDTQSHSFKQLFPSDNNDNMYSYIISSISI